MTLKCLLCPTFVLYKALTSKLLRDRNELKTIETDQMYYVYLKVLSLHSLLSTATTSAPISWLFNVMALVIRESWGAIHRDAHEHVKDQSGSHVEPSHQLALCAQVASDDAALFIVREIALVGAETNFNIRRKQFWYYLPPEMQVVSNL